jgi:RNA polymerase primary sigma factor
MVEEAYKIIVDRILMCWAKWKKTQAKISHENILFFLSLSQELKKGNITQKKNLIHGLKKQLVEVQDDLYRLNVRLLLGLYLLPENYSLIVRKYLKIDPAESNFDIYKYLPSRADLLNEYYRVEEISKKSRDSLVKSHLRLAISRAKKKNISGIDFEDLIQQGNIGLITAADKYDPTEGTQFSTYATWWIDQKISRYIANQSRIIRLPVHMHEKVYRLEQIKKRLIKTSGPRPSPLQIAMVSEFLHEDIKRKVSSNNGDLSLLGEEEKESIYEAAEKVQQILLYNRPVLSLDRKINGRDVTLGDMVPDRKLAPVEMQVEQNELKDIFDNYLLPSLDVRQKNIIKLRYGLFDGETRTLAQIGDMEGVTRERIRQIETVAIRNLRHPKNLYMLQAYNG